MAEGSRWDYRDFERESSAAPLGCYHAGVIVL